MSLLITGSLALDDIETPFGAIEKTVGGSACYIGLAASYFERTTQLISKVGTDFDLSFLKKLNQCQIDISGVEISTSEKTFHWKGKYSRDLNSRKSLKTSLNVLKDYEPKVPWQFSGPNYLVLGNFHPDIQLSILSQMTKSPKLIVLDTIDLWIETAKPQLLEVIKKCHLICINESEIRLLTGEYSIKKGASQLIDDGLEYVIVKKGEHGALLFSKTEVFYAPGLPLEDIFDPTGAGDSFLGGLMGYVSKTKDHSFDSLKRAVVYGSVMASFCVEQFGSQKLLNLNDEKIEARLQSFIDLVQFEILL